MHHREDQITASDGLALYWQAWDPEGSARGTLCLVHGLGEHSGRYGHVAEHLTEHGLSLHAIDLRGHGRSAGPRGHTPSLQQWLDDIQHLIERAPATSPRFLYGHSIGGALALAYGLRTPEQLAGIIATGPSLRRKFEVPAIKTILGKLLANVWPTFAQHSGLDPHDISRDPEIVQAYREDPLVHDWATARLFIDATFAGEDALAHAANFTLPVLIMVGDEDRIVEPSACEAFHRLAGSTDKTLRIWQHLHHEVHNEPEKVLVLEEMIEWINTRC